MGSDCKTSAIDVGSLKAIGLGLKADHEACCVCHGVLKNRIIA